MNRFFLGIGMAAAFIAAAGCDQLGLGPHQAASAPAAEPPPPPQRAIADLRPHAGSLYSDFAAGEGARYSPDELGLNALDRARLWRGMATPSAGQLVQGGGAEALVFRGCAQVSCQDGMAVVAIDTATGAAFAAVADAGGAEVLAPNDRVEALLRLNSPTRRWDDPALTQTAAAEAATP
jgi:hypothetical protein